MVLQSGDRLTGTCNGAGRAAGEGAAERGSAGEQVPRGSESALLPAAQPQAARKTAHVRTTKKNRNRSTCKTVTNMSNQAQLDSLDIDNGALSGIDPMPQATKNRHSSTASTSTMVSFPASTRCLRPQKTVRFYSTPSSEGKHGLKRPGTPYPKLTQQQRADALPMVSC